MSKRQVAISLAVSATAARDCIFRARCAGLAWPLPQGLTDETLGIGSIRRERSLAKDRPRPDWAMVHRELRRPGVTLQLLWEEHCIALPTPRRLRLQSFLRALPHPGGAAVADHAPKPHRRASARSSITPARRSPRSTD